MRVYQLNISDDVKNFIKDVTYENKWEPVTNIKYYYESDVRNENASKHVYVEIMTKEETHKLLVKHALDLKLTLFDILYSNETYFFDVIYPMYTEFAREKGVENTLRNVPHCYGLSGRNIIALENLKEKDFVSFNGENVMNDEHIILTLKALAKFHAVSYAFKDQRRQEYKKFKKYICRDFLGVETKGFKSSSIRIMGDIINDALNKLDIKTDRHIIKHCDVEDLVTVMTDAKDNMNVNKFSILAQGECWTNNMKFLYKKNVRETPVDVIFLDWHLIRPASPIFDISTFIYTIASEEILIKLDSYLDVYYTELCEEIKKLGSNPGLLYPAPVFRREWKEYCKYGFAVAFALIRFMLVDKNHVPKNKEVQSDKLDEMKNINHFLKFNEEEYTKRIRILGNFMINQNYL